MLNFRTGRARVILVIPQTTSEVPTKKTTRAHRGAVVITHHREPQDSWRRVRRARAPAPDQLLARAGGHRSSRHRDDIPIGLGACPLHYSSGGMPPMLGGRRRSSSTRMLSNGDWLLLTLLWAWCTRLPPAVVIRLVGTPCWMKLVGSRGDGYARYKAKGLTSKLTFCLWTGSTL